MNKIAGEQVNYKHRGQALLQVCKKKIGIDDLGRVRPPEFFQTGCYRTAARTKV